MDKNLYNPDYIKTIVNYTDQGIPKIIHQIWIDESIDNKGMPKEWEISPIEWKKHHDDYIYILWDKHNSLEFVKKYYSDLFDFYVNLKYTIQRCDLIRFMFLYKFGGIYSDLDNYPLENLEKYFDKNADSYFVEMNIFYKTINTNIIFTKCGVEIFNDVLFKIFKNYKYYPKITKIINVIASNGINYINKAIKEQKYNIYVLPYDRFNPYGLLDNCYELKHKSSIAACKGGSWYEKDMNIILYCAKYWTTILIILLVIIIVVLYIIFYFIDKKNDSIN